MSEPRRWTITANKWDNPKSEWRFFDSEGPGFPGYDSPPPRIEVIEAEPILARLKEAEEIVRWLADGGPCWSVHSRTMEPTFSHAEQTKAREYFKKWEGKS